VYRATRVNDGFEVAIKLLRAACLDNPEHVQRFFREARITAAVPSEHVARVFEVGTFAEQEVPFMAMEILEGHDLGWHLRRSPQLPLEQVVELVEHASRALAAVREAGVVHRDLKPSNLFLVDALPRAWKVLDFGLSRSASDPFTTSAEDVVGTPAYMAPEQLGGGALDHRTDLYALGAIAYRALTGRPPFEGELPHILYSVLTDPVPPIASLVRGIPVDVELVLVIALAKDPEERFPTVEELAAALRDAAAGRLDDAIRSWGWKLLKRRPAA
jgi:serine/threonine-protein kinase